MHDLLIIFLAYINLVAIGCDAFTDKWVERKAGISWRNWHCFKWARFYIPQAIMLFVLFYLKIIRFEVMNIIYLAAYCLAAWWIWRSVYKGERRN